MTQRTLTVLVDNVSSQPGIGCEWGLSLAIDLGGSDGVWLWDAGQTDLFIKNAAALGIDVATARGLALSHGHYDHTGGLNALLSAGFTGEIFAHEACQQARYAMEEGKAKPIGAPNALPPFTEAQTRTRLAPGLTLITEIARQQGNAQAVQGFFLDPEGNEHDDVPDDSFLLLETESGPVVILGCCHSGLANSLSAVYERTGISEVHAVLGGLHLYQASQGAMEETARALTNFKVRVLVAGHCTGVDRTEALRNSLPNIQVHNLQAGQSWIF